MNVFGHSTKKELLLNQYEKLSKIGSGTFGTVYKCRDIQTGEIVAVKKFLNPYFTEEDAYE